MNDTTAATLFAGPGEVRALARALDWGATPLGWPRTWSPALRIAAQSILDAPFPVCLWAGPEYALIYNDAYRRVLSAKHPAALGRPGPIVWAEIWAEIEPQLAQVRAGGLPVFFEDAHFVMARLEGGRTEDAWFSYSLSALRDEDGSVAALLNIAPESTARVRAEQALRESEERFRLAVESAGLGTYDWDVPNDRLYWSPEACRMFDLHETGVSLQGALERVHPDDRARARAAIAAALDPEGGGQFRCQYRTVWSDGSLHWVDAIGRIHFSGDGGARRPTRFVGILLDITKERLLLDSLREADRRKDEFLAMLAHELRNPLAPLSYALRLLGRGAAPPDRHRAALAMAERQARQLTRLVDDLLEVSRITRGKIELRPEPMGLGAAVHAAVESLMPAFEARRQQVEVVAPTRPVRIVADPARIAQVLENLLTNASKYTPDGGTIRVEAHEHDDGVEIRVIDDGVGIDPRQIPMLFELFSQIDATLDRAQGGLGIGLALVKQLVGLHGGTVSAASPGLGRGATFTVLLPRRPPG